ncbi:MAG: cohesin domain-containing protein, partial [Candidatus Bipolaricaulia bacterium]
MGVLVMGSSQALGQQVPVSIPDVEVQPGDTVSVPVEVGDLTNEGVTSYEFTVQYNGQIVEVTGAEAGPVTGDGGTFDANTSADGEVSVGFASASALSGSGTLVVLQVRGVSGGESPLAFVDDESALNEGRVSAQFTGGTATVADVFVSLPDTVTQTGQQVAIPVRTSDLTSQNDTPNVTSFDFEVAFDASVLDMTGVETQGTLSEGLDAQFGTSNGTATVAVASGQAIEGSGELIRLQADVIGSGASPLDFNQFQFNEGTPAADTTNGSLRAGEVAVSFPNVRLSTGESRVVNVSTTDLTDLGVESYQFEFSFDPSVLQVADTVITEGTQSAGTSPQIQVGDSTVTVATASDSVFSGDDPLVKLRIEGEDPGTSPLTFENFQFDEPSVAPTVITIDGQAETLANRRPQFTDAPDDTLSVAVNDTLTTTFDASDPDGDDVSFALTQAPQGATIDSASGDFSWTPSLSQADSTYQIDVRASDGVATSDTSFAVMVTNDPPQFTSVPEDTSATVGNTLTATVEANDPNGNDVSFALTQAPQGAAIDSASGDFSWTPDSTQADSTYNIGVRASDGQAASDTSFAVTVQELNDPPQFTSVPGDDTTAVNEEVTATVAASDPEGDDVSFALTQAPQGAAIDSASGDFSWTPDS